MRTFFILFISALTTASLVHAANDIGTAQLSGVSGTVLVNTGDGYVSATPDQVMSLKPGDRVMLKEQSLATISYPECAVALSEPALVTIAAQAPCGKAAALPQSTYLITPTQSTGPETDPLLPIVKTGIVVGMLAGSAFVLIDGLTDENDPASP